MDRPPHPQKSASRLPKPILDLLNAALHLAQLRATQVRELELRLRLAAIDADAARRALDSAVEGIAAEIRVDLGKTHTWKVDTGEIVEVQNA